MDARDRRAARSGPAWRAIGAWGTATIIVASLAWGCGTQPAPSSTPAPSATLAGTATPVVTSAPTLTPTPAYADTLRIGWSDAFGGFRFATEGGCCQGMAPKQIDVGSVVYSRLYRQDTRYGAVPDLADGPCLPQGDGTVIRCRLVETTFHDGTPLTADDVAYTYRLFGQDTFSGGPGFGSWPASQMLALLKEVRVVDARTVDFVLSSVDPTFLTSVLPAVPILPRRAVEASYAAFLAEAKGLTAKDLTKLENTINEETSRTPPVCSPLVDEVEALLEKLDVHLYREDFTDAETGALDACSYVGTAAGFLDNDAKALGSTGLASVAVSYWGSLIDRHPVGTGPYRFVSEDAKGIHLEAGPGYHGGLAATRYLDFVPAKGDASDVVDGTVDIVQYAPSDATFQATAATHGVRLTTPTTTGFFVLAFNVRSGRLFADLALRQALQLCVDLPRDVEAATGGTGTPVYGPVMPGTWADDPDLPKPPRDTAAARKLIEGAGWQLGADGIYAKGKVRLAAKIVVRVGMADRIKMADLIALQARDCGMDLSSLPVNYGDLFVYPHDIPGTKTSFDLVIVGWSLPADPADFRMFNSSWVTDAKHPDGSIYLNWIGFSDPALDRLAAAATSTYDQAERVSLYRQAQEEIAAQLPYLFLWAANRCDAVRSAVTTVDGPLDLTVLNWAWQPDRLVVAAAAR